MSLRSRACLREAAGGDPFEQFRRFFGQQPHDYKQHGLGSGVIVSSDGYILTNNHVVGGAEEIHVTLMDKREFTAKVIGKDAKTDLALIKIDSKDPLPVAELGNSDCDGHRRLGSRDRKSVRLHAHHDRGNHQRQGPHARRQLR